MGSTGFLWLLVAGGAVLRIARYAADRSLWGDEGALALNIIGKSPGELLGTLDFLQGAPTGFLLAEKLASEISPEELGLRAFPLLCGLASLALFMALVRRVLRPPAAAVALALFALSEPLVYFSSEVKQYETDVAVAVGLAFAAVAVDWSRLTLVRGAAVAAIGAVAAWFSHASLLVLAAVAAALLLDAVLRRDRRAIRAVLGVTAAWGGSGLVALVVNRQNTQAVASAALGYESSASSRLDALGDAWDTFSAVVGVANTATALAAVAALAGLTVLWPRSRGAALVLLAPPVVAVVVSLLGLYPSAPRFYLFLAPFLIALLAEGAWAVVSAVRRVVPLAGEAALGLLLLYPAAVAVDNLARPPGHEEVRSVLEFVDDGWRAGDALFVWYQTQYPLRYYAACETCGTVGPELASVLRPADPFDGPGDSAVETSPPSFYVGKQSHRIADVAASLAPLAGKPRVWLVFSSTWDDAFVRQTLDCLGLRLAERNAPKAVAYLYDLSRPPSRPSCPVPRR